jgi:hypothetical protein
MGYDVHITRAADWTDSESDPITPAEWLGFVAADPELRLAPECGFGEYFATWTVDGVERTWFDLGEGDIQTKNPERDTIRKMLEIAARFGAKVQGDDGEVYPTADHWPDRGVL